jgi:hypothetical protein
VFTCILGTESIRTQEVITLTRTGLVKLTELSNKRGASSLKKHQTSVDLKVLKQSQVIKEIVVGLNRLGLTTAVTPRSIVDTAVWLESSVKPVEALGVIGPTTYRVVTAMSLPSLRLTPPCPS